MVTDEPPPVVLRDYRRTVEDADRSYLSVDGSAGVMVHAKEPETGRGAVLRIRNLVRATQTVRVDVDGALQEVKESESGLFGTGRLLAQSFADVVAGRR